MDQRSSQREARTERLSRTPYARPTPNRNDRATTPKSPFAALKSIIKFVSPWRSGPAPGLPTHNGHDADQRSEDGSEDNWEGEGPEAMRGQDMFALAAAGGRSGAGFDARQAEWRARGELPGGRRETARRDLPAGPYTLAIGAPKSEVSTPATPFFPGGFPQQITSSQSAQPGVTSLAAIAESAPPPPRTAPSSAPRASRAPNFFSKPAQTPNAQAGPSNGGPAPISTPNPRPASPIPFFTPPARSTPIQADASPSQCQLALSNFLQERAGQVLTTEDLTIIETLTARIKGAQAQAQLRASGRGGWLPSPRSGEVVRGSGAAGGSAGGAGTPYKQKYLGPGMSPRKMTDPSSSTPSLNRSTTESPAPAGPEASDLPPSFPNRHLVNTILRYSATSSPLRQSHSAPVISASGTPPKRKQDTAPEDEATSKRREIEAAGKQNAAAIMMSLLEEAEPDTPRHVEPVRWNSYDRQSLHASSQQLKSSTSGGPSTPAARGAPPIPSTAPSTSHAGSTPSKQRTPTRGAAAKLEAHKEAMRGAKPLTTVDRIKGVRPWEGRSPASTPQPKGKAPKGQDVVMDGQDEEEEGDELESEYDTDTADISEVEDASRARRRRAGAPASPPPPQAAPEPEPEVLRIPQGTTFEPYRAPQLDISQASTPAPAPAPRAQTESYESATRDAIIAAPKKAEEEAKANKFAFSPQITKGWGQKEKPAEEKLEERVSSPAPRSAPVAAPTAGSAEGGYLSAKEAAKKVDKLALPFYPFTPPVLEKKPVDERAERAKDAAKARAKERGQETFVFTLELTPTPAPAPAGNMFGAFTGFGNASKSSSAGGFGNSTAAGGQWECDTCMLKNPDSAKEKCQICEAPRPAPKAAAPKAAAGGQWECDTCMLKNPDSAKEKCQICEAPRPAPKAAAAPGLNAGAQWQCDTCMLKNPDSAKEKCQICEAARPASTLASSSAPKPAFGAAAAPPAGPAPTPFTGFGAGFGPKKGGEGDWTCGACMLSNPASATEKCTVCDAPKP
ncbi:hypothetical protein IAT38_006652 [Cryptococcus sp. DSM 104549]